MRIDVPIPKKVNTNGQIVIPAIVRRAMGIKPGDYIEWCQIDISDGDEGKGEMTCLVRRIPREPQQKIVKP